MDAICSAILNKIYALGGTGRYFIISEEEFFESFPADAERDGDILKDALAELNKQGYIDIKYSGGNMYCVALLKIYSPPCPVQVEKQSDVPRETYNLSARKLFLTAFLGAALGGTAVSLISLLFLLC